MYLSFLTMHHNFIIYKPPGYISQFVRNEGKRKNKKLLGNLFDFPEGTMAIGRLDENSEGLLLLTTDGKVSELVRSKHIEKEYYVQIDGEITDVAIGKLRAGVEISLERGKRYQTLPCRVSRLKTAPDFMPLAKIRDERHGPSSWISMTLNEGKFRQIRKMTAAVGFPTLRLIRVRIGNIELHKMKAGEVLEVDRFDCG